MPLVTNEDLVTRIRALPEKMDIAMNDLLIVEDVNDTWKVKVQSFHNMIESIVDSMKDGVMGVVNDKLTEVQQTTNNVEELANDIHKTLEDQKAAEEERKQNEEERKNNDEIRNNTYEQIKADEAIRIQNEKDRVDLYNNMNTLKTEVETLAQAISDAEDARVIEENKRVDNENARGIAETARQDAETQRDTAEQERIQNEKDRNDRFEDFSDYVKALKASVNQFCKEGISQPTTETEQVVEIMEITLPNTITERYEALMYISLISTDNVNIDMVFSMSLDINSQELFIEGIEEEDIIDISKFNLITSSTADSIEVTIEYVVGAANKRVKSAIIWENLTMFKDGPSPISSCMINDFIPKSDITEALSPFTVAKNSITSYPKFFIELFDRVNSNFEQLTKDIKAFNMYPIGSIYQTTLELDPADILQGGTWKYLYGDSISEDIYVDDELQYSPKIHYWERIA